MCFQIIPKTPPSPQQLKIFVIETAQPTPMNIQMEILVT